MHIDNIRTGIWVAVTGKREEPRSDEDEWRPWAVRQATTSCNGEPFLVKAVSPPFVLLQMLDGKSGTVDIREFALTRLSSPYVRAMKKRALEERSRKQAAGPQKNAHGRITGAEVVLDGKDDLKHASCGTRLTERFDLATNQWRPYCRGCSRFA